MNFEDLETRLHDLNYRGKVVDTTGTKWLARDENLILRQGRTEYKAAPKVVNQVATLCDVPSGYARKCGAEFLAVQFNHWTPGLGQLRLVAKDDELLAVANPNCPMVRPIEIARKVDKVIHPVDYDRVYASPDSVELYAAGEKQDVVTKGDIVRGGVYVCFSPTGIFSPMVRGFVQRLVCLNGAMVTEQGFGFAYGGGGDGGDEGVMSWLSHTLREAYKHFKPEVKRLREMAATRVKPSEVLDHILRARLPEPVRNMVRARVQDEGARTLYDVYNHITYVASHQVEDPRIVARLMDRASTVTEHGSCPVCHRSI